MPRQYGGPPRSRRVERSAQRPSYVIGGYLGSGDLIQHRLELVVVIAVKQDHVYVVLGKFLGAGDPSEPPPTMRTVASLMRHRLLERHRLSGGGLRTSPWVGDITLRG